MTPDKRAPFMKKVQLKCLRTSGFFFDLFNDLFHKWNTFIRCHFVRTVIVCRQSYVAPMQKDEEKLYLINTECKQQQQLQQLLFK